MKRYENIKKSPKIIRQKNEKNQKSNNNYYFNVPINGVQVNGNRKYVLVVKYGKTEEVDIETGLSNDEYVEVKSGLTGGETIQVVTTTKQSTIRSENSSEKSGINKGNGMSNGGGDRQSMPNGGGKMPSGGGDMQKGGSMPSVPEQ